MNDMERLNQEGLTRLALRRLTRLVCLLNVAFLVLYCAVLAPLYVSLASNVLYQGAWWLNLLGIFLDILEVTVLVICYPVTVYALWRGRFRHGRSVVIAFSLFTLAKYVCNYVANCITDGALPSGSVLLDDVLLLLPSLLVELIPYWIMVALACLHMSWWRKKQESAHAQAVLNGEVLTPSDPLPLGKLFDLRNPVQGSLFVMALLIMTTRLISHLVYQMALIDWFGTPDSGFQVAVDLIGDVVVAVVAYLVGLLLVNSLHKKHGT